MKKFNYVAVLILAGSLSACATTMAPVTSNEPLVQENEAVINEYAVQAISKMTGCALFASKSNRANYFNDMTEALAQFPPQYDDTKMFYYGFFEGLIVGMAGKQSAVFKTASMLFENSGCLKLLPGSDGGSDI